MSNLKKELELPGAENFGRENIMQLHRQLNSMVGQHPAPLSPGTWTPLVQKVLAGDEERYCQDPVTCGRGFWGWQ